MLKLLTIFQSNRKIIADKSIFAKKIDWK